MATEKTSSFQLMKHMNQQAVLHTIYQNENISRVEIAEKVGLTQQTITNIVNRLIHDGLVVEVKDLPAAPNTGRRPIPLRINASEMYTIGLEVTRKHVRGVVMDFSDGLLAEAEHSLQAIEDGEQVFQAIRLVIDRLLSDCPNPDRMKGIGLSVSGPIDQKSGIVLKAEHFQWVDFRLKEALGNIYPYPVYLENDVNIIAVSENATGALVDSQNNITLLLDQGVGGAIVIDKKLYVGSRNAAGEFGNFKALHRSAEYPGTQGEYVSLTTVASISAIQRNMGLPFQTLTERLKAGDPETVRAFRTIGETIGMAVANIVTIFNPDHVLLAGRLIEQAGFLIEPIIAEQIRANAYEYSRDVAIKSIVLMDGARMAAGLVRKEMFKESILA